MIDFFLFFPFEVQGQDVDGARVPAALSSSSDDDDNGARARIDTFYLN